MSYDLILVRPKLGEDPLITARHKNDEQGDQIHELDPAKEALKLKVAEELIKENPSFERFPFDYEEIAKLRNISIEEAKLLFRNIELNTPDDGNGIQIELFDDEFTVTVPYWHAGAKTESTFQEIWKYLEIIQRESGFVLYDPQLDAILDIARGYRESLGVYTGTRQAMKNIHPKAVSDNPVKKWWQFWK